MTDTPLPGDIRQIDMENEEWLLHDDVNFHEEDGEDIGEFNPGEGWDEDEDPDIEDEVEIDELPEVGPLDPDEKPVLDELEDEEEETSG